MLYCAVLLLVLDKPSWTVGRTCACLYDNTTATTLLCTTYNKARTPLYPAAPSY
jgi:hypothetical protein